MTNLFFCLLILYSTLFSQTSPVAQHEVEVKVNIIPIYVFNKSGAAVLDLKESDLKLKIDGKGVKIDHLIRRDVLVTEEIRKIEVVSSKKPKYGSKKRNIFVVMDTVFNSVYGIHRTKIITKKIIQESKPEEQFNIYMISASRGLVHIAGPEPGNHRLVVKVNDAILTPLTLIGDYPAIYPIEDFISSFSKLKNILKSFASPKTVYLISGGFLPSRRSALFSDMIIETINQGGASLFTINPGRLQSATHPSGSHLLTYMAREAGGDHLQGSDTKTLVKRIKQSSSAYYEVVFNIKGIKDKKMHRLKIKCRRKGIKILQPKHITSFIYNLSRND